jgi:DNA-binding NarL/FixJ family response regulator
MGNTPRHIDLTPRERDVVRGVIAGRKNREMAQEFGLTEQAVKNVLSNVYHKCHVRNRLELAMFALRHHLVSDEEGHSRR